jgi:dTDP-4-dehydrorhamnose 3,5-epimerase
MDVERDRTRRIVRFVETPISGAVVVELERHEDERGFFARLWDPDELADAGLNPHLSQASISRSTRAGTLRGMHFQRPPNEEAKLVRCVRGAIFDVVLDLRPASSTYLRWHGVLLDEGNGTALYVPEGCAHGLQTLEDDSDVLYLISHPYAADASAGVRWDDPAFGIEWPEASERTIGARDRSWPDYVPADVSSRRRRGA